MRPCSAKWLDLPEAHFLNCKWVVNCGQDWVWSTWNIVGSQFMSTLLHSGDPRMASPGLQCCNCSAIASNCIQFTGYHSKQTFQATWLWCDPTRCHLPESNRVGQGLSMTSLRNEHISCWLSLPVSSMSTNSCLWLPGEEPECLCSASSLSVLKEKKTSPQVSGMTPCP